MNHLERMYRRMKKRSKTLNLSELKDEIENKKKTIKNWEKMSKLFHVCGKLSLLQAKKLKG